MASVADRLFNLIEPTVKAQGVLLWDVKFVKEGASHYLRVFIDKEEGINIDDCTNVSHAIDPIIDEADPIDVSYYLEVSSPGLDRELSREEHFGYALGKDVKIRLFKALEGKKEFTGRLLSFDGNVEIEADGNVYKFSRKEIAKANLIDIY